MKLAVVFGLDGIGMSLGAAVDAEAVVYCKSAGVPKGCVARPGAGAPGVGAGAPGVGVAPGVGPGAPGVGAPPGVGVARGRPVNRPGVR